MGYLNFGVIMRYLLILILAVFSFAGKKEAKAEYQRVRQLTAATVDMSQILDGTYRGQFLLDNNIGDLQVEVVVAAKAIVSIEIVENNMPKKEKKAYALTDIMVAKNSPEVDAVSGATTTSVALQSAVVDALAKGLIGAEATKEPVQ